MGAPSASVTANVNANAASTNGAAKPDASAFVEPQQPVYLAPSALSKPDPGDVSNPQMVATTSNAEVIDEPPPPHTLAKGKYEVKSATIWLVLAGATILVLLYVLWRVRMREQEKKRARAKLTALKPLDRMRA